MVIDTGASGLDIFQPLPHLSCPIVKEPETALNVIESIAYEMERRRVLPLDKLRLLPAIICIVDEYIALITNIGNAREKSELTSAISSLLQRGRHAKIHVVLATQEAAKKDMLINLNNVPARMAFACSNYYNSVSILGESGAEKLPGKGAMLFKSPENPVPLYLQGAFISTEEIEQLLTRIASTPHNFSNKFEISEINLFQPAGLEPADSILRPRKEDVGRKELSSIILWVLGLKTVSAIQIQRKFRIGRRAAGILDELFLMGIVSDKFANQPRNILPQSVEEVSADAIALLLNHDISIDDAAEAIQHRS